MRRSNESVPLPSEPTGVSAIASAMGVPVAVPSFDYAVQTRHRNGLVDAAILISETPMVDVRTQADPAARRRELLEGSAQQLALFAAESLSAFVSRSGHIEAHMTIGLHRLMQAVQAIEAAFTINGTMHRGIEIASHGCRVRAVHPLGGCFVAVSTPVEVTQPPTLAWVYPESDHR